MAISINQVLPVLPAQDAGAVAPELLLQQGKVIDARVLKVLQADLVRIAIGALSLDVRTEIPLQQGSGAEAGGVADDGCHPSDHARAGR